MMTHSQQATEVAGTATQAARNVSQTAAKQGKQVVQETRAQAKDLFEQAQTKLKDQAGSEQKRASQGLRSLGDELQSMVDKSGQSGMTSNVVNEVAIRTHQFADWLERRQPGEVADELRQFARRHPGLFLGGALVAGAVFGRLTRNMASGGNGGRHGPDRLTEHAREDMAPGMPGIGPEPVAAPPYGSVGTSHDMYREQVGP